MCKRWSHLFNEMKQAGNKTISISAWRQVGRKLGIDYCSEANFLIFQKYVENELYNYCYQGIELVEAGIAEYREETSDLFMCKLLELDDMGYINLMAYSIPINSSIDELYVQRIADVLLVLWDKALENSCEEIVAEIQKYLIKILERIEEKEVEFEKNSAVNALREQCHIKLSWDQNSNSKDQFIESLEELEEVCAGVRVLIRDDISINIEKVLKEKWMDELRHGEILCKILEGLADKGKIKEEKLNRFPFLKNDFNRGADVLSELRKKFLENPIAAICNKIAEHLKSFDHNPVEMEELNIATIKFFEKMYYENKIVNAKQILF